MAKDNEFVFTDHALLKLAHRKLSEEFVVRMLKGAEVVTASSSGRQIAYKKVRKMYLKVVFRKEADKTIIITQYFTKKISKQI